MKERLKLRQLLRHCDWIALGLLIFLVLFGVAMIYSASGGANGRGVYFASRQLVFGAAAVVFGVGLWKIDFRWLTRQSYVMYGIGCAVLLVLLVVGHKAKGAQSWFDLGFFRVQPSEFLKIVLALVMAHHCVNVNIRRFTGFLSALALGGCSTALILLQPDLGSAMVFVLMIFLSLWAAGAPRRYLGGLVALGLGALPFLWLMLKEYQKNRLLVFLDPTRDRLGAGYNVIQSRIAVGSGGLFGKGFMAGTQSKLRFLPEPHTDFIFSVFAEEFGFVGCTLLLICFGYLLWRVVTGALRQADRRQKIWVTAMSGWIWFQLVESVGMSMGLMPITGLPMPLMSYGGSALVSSVIAFAMMLKVGALAKITDEDRKVAIDLLPENLD